MMRVAKDDLAAVLPMFVLISLFATIAGAAALGALSTVAAVTIATAVNIFFCVRMLTLRLRKTAPKIDLAVVLGAMVFGSLIAWTLSGRPVSPHAGSVLAALTCAVFGGQALLDIRGGVQRMIRLDQSSSERAEAAQ